MISYPHLATELLFDVSQRWSKYLNMCMVASTSEVVEATGERDPFYLEPILVKLDKGQYI